MTTYATALTSLDPAIEWTVDAGAARCLAERNFTSISRHEARYLERIAEGARGQLRLRWPPELESAPALGVRFLAEVQIQGYSAATHPSVRPLLDGHPSAHRPGRYGLVMDPFPPFIAGADQLSHLIGPRLLELADASTQAARIAHAIGREASLSSAGRMLTEIVARFDSLAEATLTLRDPSWLIVASELLSTRCGPDKQMLGSPRRAVLSSSWLADKLPLGPSAATCWLERRLLVGGLVLQCPTCRYLDFRPWDTLGALEVACRRCRGTVAITPAVARPWQPSFMMDELVYQALANNGLEEMVLAQWFLNEHDASTVSLGLEWRDPRTTKGRPVETDVFAVCDGEVVIGEAKSVDNFASRHQPQRLFDLAKRLGARRLVFATRCRSWSHGAITRLGELAHQYPGVQAETLVDLLEADGPRHSAIV